MKSAIIVFGLLFSMQSYASITCNYPGLTTLTVSSDEGVDGSLHSMLVSGGPFENPIVLNAENGDQLVVDHQVSESAEETVYMASNSQNMVTLYMQDPIPEGGKATAIVYISAQGRVLKERLKCGDDSTED